jgi:thiol-disulfide isomerase/thioredoxin
MKVKSLKIGFLIALMFQFLQYVAADENEGVNFRKITLEQALEAAKKENKPVYVHGYADWCHYCKYMVDSVYPDKEVADFMNSHFVSIKIDMEKEGKELNKTIKSHTFPTMLFYDVNGELMHRAAGRRYKLPFLELAKEALDPNRQMRTFKNKYENGTATPYEVQFYFRMQEIAGMDAQLMIDDYLRKQPDSAFTNQNNWRIMYDIIKDPTMPCVNRMLDFKKELEAKYTKDSVNNKLINLHNSYLMQYIQQLDSVGFEAAKKKIKNNPKLDISEKICAWADVNKYKMKSDWDSYRNKAVPFIEKYAMDDARRINDVSNNLYDHFAGDKELMTKAEQWVKKSISILDIYKGNYVLASISFVLGKKEQALAAANHAVELGIRDKVDYNQATMLIAAIDRMK